MSSISSRKKKIKSTGKRKLHFWVFGVLCVQTSRWSGFPHFWLEGPHAWTVARELSDVQSSSEDRQLNKSKCYFIAVASWKILLWKDGFKCLSCPRLRGWDQTLAGSHLPSENVQLLKCSPPHSDRCDLLVCHFCGSWERNGHILFTGHWIK